MVRILRFLREVGTSETYGFVTKEHRTASLQALQRGIECILRCQIDVDGVPTAWCAQHDEKDFSPRKGRSYELATLSGAESVEIVRLLMSLEDPEPEVVRAVDAAIRWLEAAKIEGIRQDRVSDAKSPKGWNKVVVKDPSAPPLWARFYEIGTNRPIFCDRDGVPKYRLEEIGYERRNGYSWLGDWPRSLLKKEYPEWKRRLQD
jgi:pectate lyase